MNGDTSRKNVEIPDDLNWTTIRIHARPFQKSGSNIRSDHVITNKKNKQKNNDFWML